MIGEPGGLGNEIQRLENIIAPESSSLELKTWAKNQINGWEDHAKVMQELFVKTRLCPFNATCPINR